MNISGLTQVALLFDGVVGNAVLDYLKKDTEIDLHACSISDWKDEYDSLCCKTAPLWLLELKPEWLILAWWPKIVSQAIINCSRHSLNIHNSYLPFCKGKHPNFWAIKEHLPYGVSLHEVTTAIDGGGIYAKESLDYDWTDTGESLHKRSQDLAIKLFCYHWPMIKHGKLLPVPQPKGYEVNHANELEDASEIPLGATTGRDVLNVIRARQAYGHTAWFEDFGVKYNVSIKIEKKE